MVLRPASASKRAPCVGRSKAGSRQHEGRGGHGARRQGKVPNGYDRQIWRLDGPVCAGMFRL